MGRRGGRVAGQGRERAGSGDRRRCVGGGAVEGGGEVEGLGSGQDPRRHGDGLGFPSVGEKRRWWVGKWEETAARARHEMVRGRNGRA